MKILHLDEQRGWRGGEQQASWLIRGLVQSGHTVLIAGRAGTPFLTRDHDAADVIRVPQPFLNELDIWTAWRLSRAVLRHEVDILHAHTSHAHAIACLARTCAGRGKVVVSRRIDFKPRTSRLNRWKYSAPDAFISVSHRVDDVLEEFGIAEDRRHVVHSSIDPARLDTEPATREELGVAPDAPLLFSAGALVGHKDHVTLVNAIAKVVEQIPNIRLLIAGEGAERKAIEDAITEHRLENTVTLLGHRRDVPRLTRAADLYVSSSWSEGLGTSVLEALACGVPTVATDAGGVREMVRHGETGLLVENRNSGALAEAILQSLGHPDEAARMAEEGVRLVAREFSVDGMIEGTLKVYESLVL